MLRIMHHKILILKFFSLFCMLQSHGLRAQPLELIAEKNTYFDTRLHFTAEDSLEIIRLQDAAREIEYAYPDSAMLLLQQVITISKRTGFHDGIARSLLVMGLIEASRGKFGKSLYYYQLAFPYCQNAIYHKVLASFWYINMGSFYFNQGNYAQAARYYNEALRESARKNLDEDGNHNIAIYNNLATIYTRMEQQDKAFHYLAKAEQLSKKGNYKRGLTYTLSTKGDALKEMGLLDSSRQIYLEALQFSKQYHFEDIRQSITNGLGELMLQEGNPKEAIHYLKQIEEIKTRSNPYYAHILPGYNLGIAYYQLKDYQQAKKHLLRALHMSLKLEIGDNRAKAHKALAKVYEATGQYNEALQQQYLYEHLKDSLLNKEKAKDINELEIKYNSAQKDKEITEKQLLITRQNAALQQKNTWIGAASIGIILLISISILIYRNIRHKQNLLTGKLQILERDQEIKLLKASINGEEQERIRIGRELHDGIGGLLSAAKLQLGSLQMQHRSIATAPDLKKAVDLVDEATVEIRKTAHNLMPEILVRSGIEQAVRSYCERINTGNAPKIQLQIYGDLPRLESGFELALYRIIQELINNILKHARATHALIQLNWQEDIFHLSVEDNGIGMETTGDKGGIGLKNIISRVEAMGGNLEIESTPSVGTTIYIDFETRNIDLAGTPGINII